MSTAKRQNIAGGYKQEFFLFSFFLFQTLHAILIAITGIKNSQSIHIKSNMDQILKW